MGIDLNKFSVTQLLMLYGNILEELRKREIVQNRNNPVEGYSVWLATKAFDLRVQRNSKKGFDAIDSKEVKYEIKGRRLETPKSSRQLSIIRNLPENLFDFLIGILFDKDFKIIEAYKIPYGIVVKHASYRKHVNGHILVLRGNVLSEEGVERIDELMSSAWQTRVQPKEY